MFEESNNNYQNNLKKLQDLFSKLVKILTIVKSHISNTFDTVE